MEIQTDRIHLISILELILTICLFDLLTRVGSEATDFLDEIELDLKGSTKFCFFYRRGKTYISGNFLKWFSKYCGYKQFVVNDRRSVANGFIIFLGSIDKTKYFLTKHSTFLFRFFF